MSAYLCSIHFYGAEILLIVKSSNFYLFFSLEFYKSRAYNYTDLVVFTTKQMWLDDTAFNG